VNTNPKRDVKEGRQNGTQKKLCVGKGTFSKRGGDWDDKSPSSSQKNLGYEGTRKTFRGGRDSLKEKTKKERNRFFGKRLYEGSRVEGGFFRTTPEPLKKFKIRLARKKGIQDKKR